MVTLVIGGLVVGFAEHQDHVCFGFVRGDQCKGWPLQMASSESWSKPELVSVGEPGIH